MELSNRKLVWEEGLVCYESRPTVDTDEWMNGWINMPLFQWDGSDSGSGSGSEMIILPQVRYAQISNPMLPIYLYFVYLSTSSMYHLSYWILGSYQCMS